MDLSQKKSSFISRHIRAVTDMLNQFSVLAALKEEWDANAYATGATPAGNNLADADFQATAPHMDATKMNQAIGAVESMRGELAANQGYLEAVRP
jgi:hypothetical protein